MSISFTGLIPALKKFDKTGRYSKCGKWSIANGGYDLWWEIYYEDYPVLQCVAGELREGFGPFPPFTEDIERRIIAKVKSVYTDLQ